MTHASARRSHRAVLCAAIAAIAACCVPALPASPEPAAAIAAAQKKADLIRAETIHDKFFPHDVLSETAREVVRAAIQLPQP